jgi:hypothetical protein
MPKVAAKELHYDSEALSTGTHKGADSATVLFDRGKNFRSLGVDPDLELYAENETLGTNGTVTAATEDTVTVSGVTWDNGDTYNIYKTSSKDSFISGQWVDVSAGFKINHPKEINKHGWRKEDWDIDDRGRKKVFGPGQPENR